MALMLLLGQLVTELAGSSLHQCGPTLRPPALLTVPSGTVPHQMPSALDQRPEHPFSPWSAPAAAASGETDSTPRIATATALARTAAHAEVASLMALRRGYPKALQAVESAWRDEKASRAHLPVDRNVALLLVLDDGGVVLSEHLEEYLELYTGGNMR